MFGVARDTNEATNPIGLAAVAPGTGTLFTNVAYNEDTQEVWWEGRTPEPAGGRRMAGLDRRARSPRGPTPSGTSRGRTRTAGSPPSWATFPTSPTDFDDPRGVPIDAIIFGGRTVTGSR